MAPPKRSRRLRAWSPRTTDDPRETAEMTVERRAQRPRSPAPLQGIALSGPSGRACRADGAAPAIAGRSPAVMTARPSGGRDRALGITAEDLERRRGHRDPGASEVLEATAMIAATRPSRVDPLGDREGRAGRMGVDVASTAFGRCCSTWAATWPSGSGTRRRARPDHRRLLGQPLPGVPGRPRLHPRRRHLHRPTRSRCPGAGPGTRHGQGRADEPHRDPARSLGIRRSSPARRPSSLGEASSSRSTVGGLIRLGSVRPGSGDEP